MAGGILEPVRTIREDEQRLRGVAQQTKSTSEEGQSTILRTRNPAVQRGEGSDDPDETSEGEEDEATPDEADEEDPGTTVEAVGAVPDEGHLDERSVGCMCIFVWTRLVCVCDGIKLYVLKMCFILNVLNYYVCLLSFSLHD